MLAWLDQFNLDTAGAGAVTGHGQLRSPANSAYNYNYIYDILLINFVLTVCGIPCNYAEILKI